MSLICTLSIAVVRTDYHIGDSSATIQIAFANHHHQQITCFTAKRTFAQDSDQSGARSDNATSCFFPLEQATEESGT